jgi:hypothetical protein
VKTNTIRDFFQSQLNPEPVKAGGFEEYLRDHIKPDGGSYSFRGHQALREPLLSEKRDLVILKGAQVGMSTGGMGLMLFSADAKGRNVIYYLPTNDMAAEFGSTRLNAIIDRDDHLKAVTRELQRINPGRRGKDTMTVKRVRDNFIYIKGLETPIQAISVPADVLIFDEVDDLDVNNMAFALDRVAHSSERRVIRFGVGRFPGGGIDAAYMVESDKRVRVYRCPVCRREHVLEDRFPDNVYRDKAGRWFIGCDSAKCGAEIDRDGGEWTAQEPGRETVGYRISQLQIPAVSMDHIMSQYRKALNNPSLMAKFRCSTLALPDAGDSQPITDEVLKRCTGERGFAAGAGFSFLGIDRGNECHFAIGEPIENDGVRFLLFGKHPEKGLVREVKELDRRFHFLAVVVDAAPGTKGAQDIADALGRERVFLQKFTGNVFQINDYEPVAGTRDIYQKVTMDRTDWLDCYTDLFQTARVVLPPIDGGQRAVMEEVWSHHIALQRVQDPNTLTIAYRRAVNNHYGMAGSFVRAGILAWRYGKPRPTGALVMGGRFRI